VRAAEARPASADAPWPRSQPASPRWSPQTHGVAPFSDTGRARTSRGSLPLSKEPKQRPAYRVSSPSLPFLLSLRPSLRTLSLVPAGAALRCRPPASRPRDRGSSTSFATSAPGSTRSLFPCSLARRREAVSPAPPVHPFPSHEPVDLAVFSLRRGGHRAALLAHPLGFVTNGRGALPTSRASPQRATWTTASTAAAAAALSHQPRLRRRDAARADGTFASWLADYPPLCHSAFPVLRTSALSLCSALCASQQQLAASLDVLQGTDKHRA